ncbi:MAG: ATP-binding protein [Candidatus Binatia bacterium]
MVSGEKHKLPKAESDSTHFPPAAVDGPITPVEPSRLDASGRKQPKAECLDEQLSLSMMLDALPGLVAILGSDGTIVAANTAWKRHAGRTSASGVVGTKVGTNYLHAVEASARQSGGGAADVLSVIRTGLAGEAAPEAVEYRSDIPSTGQWFRLHVAPLAGRQVRALVAQVDITDRKRAEGALRRFSYSIAHDLHAPLRAISSFAESLAESCSGHLDSESEHYLDRIRAGVGRMKSLIDKLLDFSLVTQHDLAYGLTDLSALSAEIVEELQAAAPERRVEVLIDPAVQAWGDATLLRDALDNLLSNAWKFTSKRAVARIEFGATWRNGRRVYFVRDNGAGFDMAFASRLFEPFGRLHSRKEFEGAGIGLATVREIVHRHAGRTWAEGAVGQGATFYFTLGRQPSEACLYGPRDSIIASP